MAKEIWLTAKLGMTICQQQRVKWSVKGLAHQECGVFEKAHQKRKSDGLNPLECDSGLGSRAKLEKETRKEDRSSLYIVHSKGSSF